jgi:hypothetical protein
MKIKQLVELAIKNPALMEMELSIALRPDEQRGGILDGATSILFNPVKTVMPMFGDGILLFPDPTVTKSQTFVPGAVAQFPQTCIGPVPDWLK